MRKLKVDRITYLRSTKVKADLWTSFFKSSALATPPVGKYD